MRKNLLGVLLIMGALFAVILEVCNEKPEDNAGSDFSAAVDETPLPSETIILPSH